VQWKCRHDGLVHEVYINHGPNSLDSSGTRVGLACGIDVYYTLSMNVLDPDDVPTTCIACIADSGRRQRDDTFLRRKADEAAMRNAFVDALGKERRRL